MSSSNTTDHANFVALATRLIAKHGVSMTLRTETSTSGWPPVPTVTETTITGVRTGNVSDKQISNSDGRLKAGDAVVIIDSSVAPDTASKLVDGDDVYQIVEVQEVRPGQSSIMWRMVVRA